MITLLESGHVYARQAMKVVGDQCEVSVVRRKVAGPCPDGEAQKRLSKAQRFFLQSVIDPCEPWLRAHAVPFGPPCDGLIGSATPGQYVDCVATAAEAYGMRGVRTVWYGD